MLSQHFKQINIVEHIPESKMGMKHGFEKFILLVTGAILISCAYAHWGTMRNYKDVKEIKSLLNNSFIFYIPDIKPGSLCIDNEEQKNIQLKCILYNGAALAAAGLLFPGLGATALGAGALAVGSGMGLAAGLGATALGAGALAVGSGMGLAFGLGATALAISSPITLPALGVASLASINAMAVGSAAGAAGIAALGTAYALPMAALAGAAGVGAAAFGLANATPMTALGAAAGIGAVAVGGAALLQSLACMASVGGCIGYLAGGLGGSSLNHLVWNERAARAGAFLGAAIQGIAVAAALGLHYGPMLVSYLQGTTWAGWFWKEAFWGYTWGAFAGVAIDAIKGDWNALSIDSFLTLFQAPFPLSYTILGVADTIEKLYLGIKTGYENRL